MRADICHDLRPGDNVDVQFLFQLMELLQPHVRQRNVVGHGALCAPLLLQLQLLLLGRERRALALVFISIVRTVGEGRGESTPLQPSSRLGFRLDQGVRKI